MLYNESNHVILFKELLSGIGFVHVLTVKHLRPLDVARGKIVFPQYE